MFEFIRKEVMYPGHIYYIWNITRCNRVIGTIKLTMAVDTIDKPLLGSAITATFYSDQILDMTEDAIYSIVDDFKQLTNERLLDIDEEYSDFYFIDIEIKRDDCSLFNPILRFPILRF